MFRSSAERADRLVIDVVFGSMARWSQEEIVDVEDNFIC